MLLKGKPFIIWFHQSKQIKDDIFSKGKEVDFHLEYVSKHHHPENLLLVDKRNILVLTYKRGKKIFRKLI